MLMNNVDTSKMLAPASEQDARTWNPKPETLNFELWNLNMKNPIFAAVKSWQYKEYISASIYAMLPQQRDYSAMNGWQIRRR